MLLTIIILSLFSSCCLSSQVTSNNTTTIIPNTKNSSAKDLKFSLRETPDNSFGEVKLIWADSSSTNNWYYKIQLSKNEQTFFTRFNTSFERYKEFKKFDNIVKVDWETKRTPPTSTYWKYIFEVTLHRYSLEGSHRYSNNISGTYRFTGFYSSGSYSRYNYIFYEHVQLEWYKKSQQELVLDCIYDVYDKIITSVKYYLNGTNILEYTLSKLNDIDTNEQYDVIDTNLNNRAQIRISDNSGRLVFSNPDQSLNGDYYCQISYTTKTSAKVDTLNSNLVHLNIK